MVSIPEAYAGAARMGVAPDALLARAESVAVGLAELGVEAGSGVMLVLGDQVERWEAALAVSLLDAVVVPESPDLVALVAAGIVTHVVAGADVIWELEGVAGNCTRIAVGPRTVGWARYPA